MKTVLETLTTFFQLATIIVLVATVTILIGR